MIDKTNIKTTDWLTKGMTDEQIAREKREAIMSADLEECMSFDIWMKKETDEKTVDYDYVAEKMVAKGYCKKSDAIDEFVKMLKDTSMTKWDYHEAVDIEEIDRIAAKMKDGKK